MLALGSKLITTRFIGTYMFYQPQLPRRQSAYNTIFHSYINIVQAIFLTFLNDKLFSSQLLITS